MLTTKSLLVLSMAYMSFATSEAYALEEWRVLGPAYSYHLSKDGAMFSGDEKWACQTKHRKQKKALDNTIAVTETKLGQFAQYELPTTDGAAIKTAIGPSPFVITTNMVVEENGSKRVEFFGLCEGAFRLASADACRSRLGCIGSCAHRYQMLLMS